MLIDRDARPAVVNAAPLPGAGLAVYQALEARVAATAEGWTITLVPPAAAFPNIPVADDTPEPVALGTAIWGARRLNLPIGVSGTDAAAVVTALIEAGANAQAVPGTGGADGAVRLRWLAPQAVE